MIVLATDGLTPSAPRTYQALFGLRAVQVANTSVHYWLSNSTPLTQVSVRDWIYSFQPRLTRFLVHQVQEKFDSCLTGDKWRLELRIRCVPSDLHDLYEKDKATFVFYYDQVILVGCFQNF